jgi:DNA-binding cell septation regulator SpoVG
MADRIFPNKYQVESLDSELVFKGIDWDNFNQKLAQAKDSKKETDSEVKDIVKKLDKSEQDEIEEMLDEDDVPAYSEKNKKSAGKMCSKCDKQKCACTASKCTCADKCKCDASMAKKTAGKMCKVCEMSEDDCTCEHEDDASMVKHAPKRQANKIIFNHPDQISAEAVEAAFASGDEQLGNAILAARHERRVRLAKSIEKKIVAENDTQLKLAQRKAYREKLVQASEKTAKPRLANKSEDGFVKVSELSGQNKKAFAAKAAAAGFPSEYVAAMLGESVSVEDKTAPIREIMASSINNDVKKKAVTSMIKEATLTNSDYDRLINYWKNELGYGDQEWIDALFTKKYDNK